MLKKTIFNEKDLDLKRWSILSKELESYLGKTIEEIKKGYFKKIKSQEKSFDPLASEKDIVRYYKDTDHYLYELLYWESCKSKYIEFKKVSFFIKRYHIKNTLDYGGGIGSLCIYLNERGISCDYLDIPGKTSDFASWRFKKRGIKNEILFPDSKFVYTKYNLIVSYDVLEHVYDIENIAKHINGLLNNAGYFICKCTFSGGGLHLSRNEKYNDISLFSGMLEQKGFLYCGRIKPILISELFRRSNMYRLFLGIRIDKKLKYGGNFLIFRKVK